LIADNKRILLPF